MLGRGHGMSPITSMRRKYGANVRVKLDCRHDVIIVSSDDLDLNQWSTGGR
jgi:hypothetical protein